MIAPEEIVPMFTKLPDASILCVPPVAPVLIPVVPFSVVPVIVLAVDIVPKPDAMEPEAKAPTVVREDVRTFDGRVVPTVNLVTSSPVAM